MTDHKYTDEEVIKALECCNTYSCDGCPYRKFATDCVILLPQNALDLVERQKAEIEALADLAKQSNCQCNLAIAMIDRQHEEIGKLNTVHADMTESLRLAAEANKDMSVELDSMRGAANSYKMHYEEAERKYKIAVAEREANVEGFIETLKTIKSEAIKEFAERLKANMSNIARMEYGGNIYFCVGYDLIDNLVKEMTEEKTNEFSCEST